MRHRRKDSEGQRHVSSTPTPKARRTTLRLLHPRPRRAGQRHVSSSAPPKARRTTPRLLHPHAQGAPDNATSPPPPPKARRRRDHTLNSTIKPRQWRSWGPSPHITTTTSTTLHTTKKFPRFCSIKPHNPIVSLHCSINPQPRRCPGGTDTVGPCRSNFGSGSACVTTAFYFLASRRQGNPRSPRRRRLRGPDINRNQILRETLEAHQTHVHAVRP